MFLLRSPPAAPAPSPRDGHCTAGFSNSSSSKLAGHSAAPQGLQRQRALLMFGSGGCVCTGGLHRATLLAVLQQACRSSSNGAATGASAGCLDVRLWHCIIRMLRPYCKSSQRCSSEPANKLICSSALQAPSMGSQCCSTRPAVEATEAALSAAFRPCGCGALLAGATAPFSAMPLRLSFNTAAPAGLPRSPRCLRAPHSGGCGRPCPCARVLGRVSALARQAQRQSLPGQLYAHACKQRTQRGISQKGESLYSQDRQDQNNSHLQRLHASLPRTRLRGARRKAGAPHTHFVLPRLLPGTLV